jgi:hypothetical protein
VCAGDGARGEAKSGSGLVMPPCRGVAASAAEMSVAGVVNEAGGQRGSNQSTCYLLHTFICYSLTID